MLAGLGVSVALAACSSSRTPGADRSGSASQIDGVSVSKEIIARSRRGAPLTVETLTPARPRPGAGPVLIIGCIHGDEREGIAAFDVVRAEAASAGVAVLLVESMNPDGEAANSRGNAAGVDLNRNWPTANFRPGRAHGPSPLSEPETRGLHELLGRALPSLVVVLHSTGSGPFVNFDGPAEELAARFAEAAQAVDPRWRVVSDMGYPTPGSLGTLVGDEMGIPILTIEFKRGQDSASVRSALKAGLRAVLGSS